MSAVAEKMPILVNDDLTKFGSTKGTIVLEVMKPGTPDQLTCLETRNMLMLECRNRGFPIRGISNSPTPFPFDDKGESSADKIDEMILGKADYVGWRIEYEVSAGVGG